MTIQEYHYYSDIAVRLFNYMNGKINRLNSQCTLQINMYDMIDGTYGNIRYPNFIFINVGTIVDGWYDSWSAYMNKEDYICSCIAWAISHELHHADQLISMVQYNHNAAYKLEMENDVNRASYDWVCKHSKTISKIGGFNCLLKDITSDGLVDEEHYRKASVKQFYCQTIANIIIRDLDEFSNCKMFTDDNDCDDIIVSFNNTDSVIIKSYGHYLAENVNTFSQLAYKWAGYYDTYSIAVDGSYKQVQGRKICYLNFNIYNPMIHGMKFKS